MVEESSPPLAQTPRGTSVIRCSRTEARSSESSSSLASPMERGLGVETKLPPGMAVDVAVAPLEKFAGQQLLDALDQSVRSGDVVEREEVGEAVEIQAARDLGVEENGLQLGAEVEVAAAVEEVEGLDAHAVAGEDEALSLGVPEGDGEHAAETREDFDVPLEEAAEDDLGVAERVEAMAAGFEFGAEFGMVVDLAVIDDGDLLAGFGVDGVDGLVAVVEVDDFQAGIGEGDVRGLEGAEVIGSAMVEGCDDLADAPRFYGVIQRGKASDAAHKETG